MSSLFVIDDKADEELLNKEHAINAPKVVTKELGNVIKSSSKTKSSVDEFCKLMGWGQSTKSRKNKHFSMFPELNEKTGKVSGDLAKTNVAKAMETSVLKDIESAENLKRFSTSHRKLQDERRIERAKTKGSNWYNLPATEVTDEIKKDLEILQMRSALDPKHFYKKNDLKVLPKYFQMGKILDTPLDYYNDRSAKKGKKRTMVDELMADAEFQRYNKKKYGEIMESKQKTGYYKANKKMKKLKKKK